MKYTLYLDDSGSLVKKNDFFLYGGLLIQGNFGSLRHNYKKCVLKIKKELNMKDSEELKARGIKDRHRRFLLSNLKHGCWQVFVVANIQKLTRVDFDDKRKKVNYKNFMIKVLVEEILKTIATDCDEMDIFIDNQSISNSSKDSLCSYLYNTFNYDAYYYYHLNNHHFRPAHEVKFNVTYKDSKTDYLMQAADMLANTKLIRFQKFNHCGSEFLQTEVLCVKLPHDAFFSSSKANNIPLKQIQKNEWV